MSTVGAPGGIAMNQTHLTGSALTPKADKKNPTSTWWLVQVVVGLAATFLIGLHPVGGTTVWIRFLGYHVIVARGGELVVVAIIAVLLTSILLPACAIIHAIRTPKSTFTLCGRSKSRWVVSMIILFMVGDIAFLLLPIYYLMRIRLQMNRNQAAAFV